MLRPCCGGWRCSDASWRPMAAPRGDVGGPCRRQAVCLPRYPRRHGGAAGRRHRCVERRLKAMRETAADGTELAAIYRDIGLPVVEGLTAFHHGAYAQAVEHLLPARFDLWKMGGARATRRDRLDTGRGCGACGATRHCPVVGARASGHAAEKCAEPPLFTEGGSDRAMTGAKARTGASRGAPISALDAAPPSPLLISSEYPFARLCRIPKREYIHHPRHQEAECPNRLSDRVDIGNDRDPVPAQQILHSDPEVLPYAGLDMREVDGELIVEADLLRLPESCFTAVEVTCS